MKCEDVGRQLPLTMYGELSFDEEEAIESHLETCADCRREMETQRALWSALDDREVEIPPGMLAESRRELRARFASEHAAHGIWDRLVGRWGLRWRLVHPALQPVGAVALLLLGYFGSRVVPPMGSSRAPNQVDQGLVPDGAPASRVRYVERQPSGEVKIGVEEERHGTMTGRPNNETIRRLLVAAAQDPSDPALRVESVDLLRGQLDSAEVRSALVSAVEHDPNPGVRLKALDGLKGFAGDPDTRRVLAQVLLKDKNPGVRTQAIDLLVQHQGDQMVGLLQELMRKDDNGYVRLRCQRALHDLNASEGTF